MKCSATDVLIIHRESFSFSIKNHKKGNDIIFLIKDKNNMYINNISELKYISICVVALLCSCSLLTISPVHRDETNCSQGYPTCHRVSGSWLISLMLTSSLFEIYYLSISCIHVHPPFLTKTQSY